MPAIIINHIIACLTISFTKGECGVLRRNLGQTRQQKKHQTQSMRTVSYIHPQGLAPLKCQLPTHLFKLGMFI